jgi:hypothetical protein
VPTGTLTLTIDSRAAATVPLTAAGTAASTLTFPSDGAHTITAAYSGDASNAPSSAGAAVTVIIPVLTVTGSDVTVVAGDRSANTSTITVTPDTNFTGEVALSAAITSSPAGAKNLPTLSFGSTSPVFLKNGPGSATLIISTSAPTKAESRPMRNKLFGAGGLAFAGVLLLGLRPARRKWTTLLGIVLVTMFLAAGLSGCQGSGAKSTGSSQPTDTGTTHGAYVIKITATAGSFTSTGTINVQVQ